MLAALARTAARRHRAAAGANGGFLEALASSTQSVDLIAEAASTSTSTTSTSSASRSSIAAASVPLPPAFSRGFAAKAQKNKKKGRGGNKRNDSDSDDDGGESAPSSSASPPFDLEATRRKMSSSLERLKKALSGLHAGRASPSMLEHVSVTLTHAGEGDGPPTSSHAPLQALAAVTVRDASTLVVTPFDPSPAAAAAITAALKLPPLRLENVRQERSGELVVPVPRATPEAVAALVKLARGEAEAARVAVRSARKEANKAIGSLDGGDDAKKRSERSVQAVADEFVKKVDAALAAKESDLAAV